MSAIVTEDLGKIYEGGTVGLRGLTLEVSEGTIFGFLGPNGAGKTTTVRLLNGTLGPSGGSARVLGFPLGSEEIRRSTATLTETARMYEHMTTEGNLRFFAELYGLQPSAIDRRIASLLDRLRISDRRDTAFGALSTGLKKRVQLARTLLHSPRIVFLDEPTSGLDPEASEEVTSLIRDLAREEGVTVFLCTHNLPQAERVCDVFGFIRDGELVACGGREEMIRSVSGESRLEIRTRENVHLLSCPDEERINSLVREVMDRGEHLLSVRRLLPDLSEVYFHYIGRSRSGGEEGAV